MYFQRLSTYGTDLERRASDNPSTLEGTALKTMRRIRTGTGARRLLRSGFSMVELLLVLAMLGVVTTVAMPAISRSLTSVRADRAAAMTAADMKLAFSMAARQNQPVQLNMLVGQRQYTVTDRATGAVLMRRNFGPGAADLTVSSLEATDAIVEIFPNGLAQNGVDYTIRVGQHQRLVRMTRTGHVTVN